MIEKIISGGQTGADRAALDTALKYGIPHGGWIPRGRIAEDGRLPDKYRLQELGTESYAARTERNVLDSDGTLIVSHGELTGGSLLTRTYAVEHDRPFLHVDLSRHEMFSAARDIHAWVLKNEVAVLNVAGPRASGDARIYTAVVDLLETMLYLDTMHTSTRIPVTPGTPEFPNHPRTVEQAVERFTHALTLKERASIGRMSKEQFLSSYAFVTRDIARDYGLFTGNTPLLASCAERAGEDRIAIDEAARVILGAVWEKLNKTHSLRVVK
ncbi:MAG: putative molybdenum carrier protein [Desulfatibacillaceae bacterium]